MKKSLLMGLCVMAILCATGCGNEKEVMKTCTLTSNNVAQGYKMENEYKIYGKGKIANKVVTTETITSSSQEILDYLESYAKETYEANNKAYGGYTVKFTNENGKLVSETTIDYTKMDIEKFISDNSVMKNYVNSKNEPLMDGLIKIYEATGATCK